MFFTILVLQTRKDELANAVPTLPPSATPTFIPAAKPSAKATVTVSPELAVVDTFPEDKATDVPYNNAYIDVFFNKDFTNSSFIFSIRPEAKLIYDYSAQQTEKKLRIYMSEPLKPSTEYTFRVNTFKLIPKNYTFTTQAASESAQLGL